MYEKITQINDSRIELFHSLRLSSGRFEALGLFMVEGEVAFRCLLESGCRIHTLFIDDELLKKYNLEIESIQKKNTFPCLIAEKSLMSEIVGFHLHQGAMALVVRPDIFSPEDLPLPAIALNGIEKADNAGTIIRTAVALGVNSFILDAGSCDPLVRRAVRVSMGAVLFCNLSFVPSLASTIEDLRRNKSLKVLSLEQGEGSELLGNSLPLFDIMIIGNESRGVDKTLLDLSDHIVQIPLGFDKVRSLNVGVSLGIALSRMKISQSTDE